MDVPTKKKEMTEGAFNALLFQLDPDRDEAAAQYETIRSKLIKYFEWQRSPHPEEDADETIDRVAQKIQQGEVFTSVIAYARGVAKLIYLETVKKQASRRKALREINGTMVRPGPDQEVSERLLQRLDKCLETLPEEHRGLISKYYDLKDQKAQSRSELAMEIGVPNSVLRLRAHRIRKRLEDCIRKVSESEISG